MAFYPHSQPEAVYQTAHDTDKYPYHSPDPIPTYDSAVNRPGPNNATDTNKIAQEGNAYERKTSRTICGLHKRIFWILVAIVIIVLVAGAVGGGVGGALTSQRSNNIKSDSTSNVTEAPQSYSQVSSTVQTPTSSTRAITTTTLIGPTSAAVSELFRDCPSSNNTIYTVSYGSTSQQYRKLCSNAYLNINDRDAVVNVVVSSLDECINRCSTYDINYQTDIQAGRARVCNAVSWRNTFDGPALAGDYWPGGMCWGYTTQNTTVDGKTTFVLAEQNNGIADSAALMN